MLLANNDNYLDLINKRLDLILSKGVNQRLLNASRYVVLGGGKRIRPLLSIAAGQLSAAKLDTALDVGCALELIHSYSLVHDDLPAMDNDDLRRGQPTCHKKYDEATAILVGDALQALAFEVLSADLLNIPLDKKLKIINQISGASGINGMVSGQMFDLESTGQKLTIQELQQMHACKTGALIKAAILCGYLCGGNFSNDVYNKLEQIANDLGLLFQIVDDILDVTQNSDTLGKTANKDAKDDKATYVSLLGLNEAKLTAENLYERIRDNLAIIDHSQMLKELSDSIYIRNK